MSVYIYRLSQWLEKKFNAKGGNVITDLDPVAQAQLSYAVGVEDRYLQGWNRFSVVINQAAVAAQFSRVRIRNPVGSNVMVVLEQLAVYTTGATDAPVVTWGAQTADLLTLVVTTFTRMDPRGNPQPTSIVSQNAQAAGGQAFMERTILTNSTADYINSHDQQLTNLPGQAIDIQSVVANNNMVVTLMWREHALELSELT